MDFNNGDAASGSSPFFTASYTELPNNCAQHRVYFDTPYIYGTQVNDSSAVPKRRKESLPFR
jgi:hypothetical protein